MDSCFFWDPVCPLGEQGQKHEAGMAYAPEVNMGGRKVISYNAYGDGSDYEGDEPMCGLEASMAGGSVHPCCLAV